MKITVILLILLALSLPVKVFGQTSATVPIYKSIPLPATTTKPISSTSPQETPKTKPVNPELVDESYCHGFDSQSCLSPRCQLVPSCPVCLDIGSCHAKNYHKWNGKEYDPPRYSETNTRKIEIKSTDGTKNIEITDNKGVTKTVEPKKLNEIVLSPDPEKCKPKPCTVLTLKVEDGKTVISSNGIVAKTSLPIKIEESKISVETNGENIEVLDPAKVKETILTLTKSQQDTVTVTSISLEGCNLNGESKSSCKEIPNIYKVSAIKQNKFLGFLPVKSKLSYILNAITGNTVSKETPWYLKTLPFLFK